MNVLSLFDGISCGRIALERAGVSVTNYFACEIDKYAMQVSKANYPDIKQMGDVRCIEIIYDLKSETTRIYNWFSGQDFTFKGKFDMIIGGSPCQGFSFAGKQLNFSDPRSKLFFEFVRLFEDIQKHNPKVLFFLENVQMKKEYQNVISEYMDTRPILINSALVSAQNRKRLYWTNLPFFKQPEDRFIFIKDIIEGKFEHATRWQNSMTGNVLEYEKSRTLRVNNVNNGYRAIKIGIRDEMHFVKNKYEVKGDKSMCLDANYYKGEDNHGQRSLIKMGNINGSDSQNCRVYSSEGKSPTLRANSGGNSEPKIGIIQINGSKESHNQQPFMGNRVYSAEGKSVALTQLSHSLKISNDKILTDEIHYRKLSPIECERLQTVHDNYTASVSNTQRYKMLGNGWNVETIVHFFRWIPILDEL